MMPRRAALAALAAVVALAGAPASSAPPAGDPTVDISALRRLRYVVRGGELRAIEELRPAREE